MRVSRIRDFLELDSVEDVIRSVEERETDWDSAVGQQALLAIQVHAMRQLDRAATRLQCAALAIGIIGLILTGTGTALTVWQAFKGC